MPNKILVIDDDNDRCLLLSRFLTRHGFEVATVGTGAAALEWMKKSEPLLVLCDFRIGNITGAEMLSKIKERFPVVPVIIITGYSDVKDAVEVMKMGAYDYVTKPLFPDEILVTIRKALSEPGTTSVKVAVSSEPASESASAVNGKAKKGGTPAAWNNDQYILGDSEAFATIVKQIDRKSTRLNSSHVALSR